MAKEIYYSMDKTKFIVKKTTSSNVSTTYIWETYYNKYSNFVDQHWYMSADDVKLPIRRIKKVVEDDAWNIECFYPDGDDGYRFVFDDREDLNYI